MTLQSAFSDALLDPSLPVPEGIVRPDGKPAGKRFNVYRNNVIYNLIEALGAAYPLVKKRVGTEFFTVMAGVFVRSNPPRSPLMILYGETFAEFLTTFDPATAVPWLADLAQLERARREAFHAADATPDGFADMAGLDAEDMMQCRVSLLPSTRVVQSDYPIWSIWHALEQDLDLPSMSAPEDVLVSRPEMVVEMHLLPPGGASFLNSLAKGRPLGLAAEDAATSPEFDLGRTIGGLFETRLITSVQLEKSP